MRSLFKLKLFFQIENLCVAALHERVIVRFKIGDELSLTFPRRYEVLDILL